MDRPAAQAWAVTFALAGGLEVVALLWPQRYQTLSSATRHLFRTDTRAGRAAFRLTWAGFGVWFYRHILHP